MSFFTKSRLNRLKFILFTNGLKLIILYTLFLNLCAQIMKQSFFLLAVFGLCNMAFASEPSRVAEQEADWVSQIMPPSSRTSSRYVPSTEPAKQKIVDISQAQTDVKINAEETPPLDPSGVVVRSVFTTEVINKEPFDEVIELGNNVQKIYFFTEFIKLNGQTAKHLWYYQDKLVAEIPFDIQSSRWRAWSSKSLKPNQRGSWTVKVVDNNGKILSEKTFSYVDVTGLEVSTD